MKPKVDYSLYLVTDRLITKGRDLLQAVEEAIRGGVTLVQLREKSISSRDFYTLALEMKALTQKYRIPLIINDRLDIMLAVDADGLHVGEDDLPLATARRLLGPEKILGYSAGNITEALRGQEEGADYLGSGPVYLTGSKADAGEPIGLTGLQAIKESVKIPVVAIGGIDLARIPKVRETGVDGIAVISAILGQPDPKETSRALAEAWRGKANL
ncbi:MAG: thiamine phosphate synthase [Bacillota bacterium]|uniref:Thiamine-phosphate synthase n=1 Tax=Thermanaerosceptrum fracticalcis TaxID=1712410 RepID=A0A7G6E7T9_THEFR|nr:thiamine phosphate synthase [Thermanaerosceptrum fracticalcis]QNB48143.1 thiamine phosphate synthase [Thermanaerosceptrum fracticalcis]